MACISLSLSLFLLERYILTAPTHDIISRLICLRSTDADEGRLGKGRRNEQGSGLVLQWSQMGAAESIFAFGNGLDLDESHVMNSNTPM